MIAIVVAITACIFAAATTATAASIDAESVYLDTWHTPRYQWSHIAATQRRFPPTVQPPALSLLDAMSRVTWTDGVGMDPVISRSDVAKLDGRNGGDGGGVEQGKQGTERWMPMKSGGVDFVCFLPPLPVPATAPSDADVNGQEAETAAALPPGAVDVTAVRDAAVKALDDMRHGDCLYATIGWWTYEYCHMQHMRQYHRHAPDSGDGAENDGQPAEPVFSFDFILGRQVSTTADGFQLHLNGGNGGDGVESSTSGKGEDTSTTPHGATVSTLMRDGTMCDVTGRPRQVKVEFVCSRQHPQTDRIAAIREAATCRYTATILTPRLCDLPLFAQKESAATPLSVHCKRVVEDGEYERLMTEREALKAAAVEKAKEAMQKKLAGAAARSKSDAHNAHHAGANDGGDQQARRQPPPLPPGLLDTILRTFPAQQQFVDANGDVQVHITTLDDLMVDGGDNAAAAGNGDDNGDAEAAAADLRETIKALSDLLKQRTAQQPPADGQDHEDGKGDADRKRKAKQQ